MSNKDLGGFAVRQFANCSLSKAGLAINAASAPTFKTVAGTVAIDGIQYSVGAQAARALTALPNAARPLYQMPENTTCYFLVVTNSAGTAYVLQSDFLGRDLSAFGLAAKGTGEMPECPAGYAPLGVIKVVTKPGQTFLPGTDALDNAVKATFTFVDCLIVPTEF